MINNSVKFTAGNINYDCRFVVLSNICLKIKQSWHKQFWNSAKVIKMHIKQVCGHVTSRNNWGRVYSIIHARRKSIIIAPQIQIKL